MEKVDFAFTEASLKECTEAAERFAAEGANWHNHVLKPTCLFNPRPGTYALVIENNSSGEILVHFAGTNPVAEEQHIVKLRHGAAILDAPSCVTDSAGRASAEPELLARIRAVSEAKADWHHHMMFPDCVLNPRPGEWLITLEVSGEDDILQHASREEPVDVLRTIEHLFFAQETGS